VTLRCWNLPQVGQLLVDESGGLVVASFVCPILHQLHGNGICRDGAHTGGASRPASKFVDGSPCLAAGVREVDGVDSFLHRSCFFCCNRESRDEVALSEAVPTGARIKER